MAEIAKSGRPSMASVNPPQSSQIPGLLSSDTIAAGDMVYIASDGTVKRASGAAATAPALSDGMALSDASVGDPVTILVNINVRYGAGLVPGARYYLSGTVVGGIADAASTGGTTVVAKAIDATRIRVLAPGR